MILIDDDRSDSRPSYAEMHKQVRYRYNVSVQYHEEPLAKPFHQPRPRLQHTIWFTSKNLGVVVARRAMKSEPVYKISGFG